MPKYQCVNETGECSLAYNKKIKIEEGKEPKCEECGRELEIVKPKPIPTKIILSVVGLLVVVVATLLLILMNKPDEPPPPGIGPCKLQPVADAAAVARLRKHIEQGMKYAAENKPEDALSEFRQGLEIDKNFLGLNQNIAAALMLLGKYEEAESSLNKEIDLIDDCFKPIIKDDEDIAKLAYMLDIEHVGSKAKVFRERITTTRRLTAYNQACLYSLQKQKEPALDALREAIDLGFDDRKALDSDPNLSFIRTSAEFKKILSEIK